ncbi:hypothetical protein H4K35_14630 [Myroides sp. NP-2]|uniref:hypothetical protein n=1 Tax=Myroides sp. NP-2 TaxID=2759945 RepID=UPI0015FE51C6|nr:hypothetical protein [Myroides sp. NP-2]MBB1151320.1 hypothetical protein [Myroides sp. NP-2]
MINVLWLDDEHKVFQPLKDAAIMENIQLVGYDNAEDGLLELTNNFNHYDAVILDGIFFTDKTNSKQTDEAFGNVAKGLLELRTKGFIIPVFIYSGQPSFVKDSHSYVNLFKDEFSANGRVFDKTDDDGMPELLLHIKEAVKDNVYTKIRHQYSDVFKYVSYIPTLDKHYGNFLELLKNIDTDQELTKVRMIIESLFKALADINIIPQGFTEEKGWINGTSLFISGKHSDYEFTQPDFIHPTICETLYRVLNIVQDGSHNEGSLKLKVDDYSRKYASGYLYKSVVYGLLEILCYFGELIKNNQNVEENQSRWNKKEIVKTEEVFIEAIFQSINEANWGTIKCIDGKEVSVHPKSIETHNLAIGEIIWVSLEFNEPKNKYHIKNIKKNNG